MEGMPAPRSPRKATLHTPGSAGHVNPIPEGVRAGGFLFLSAVRGVDAQRRVPEDPLAEARLLFQNLAAVLGAAGGSLADVVKMGVFMADLARDRPAFNTAWQEAFGDDPPARFAVQVAAMGMPGDGTRFLADVTALALDEGERPGA